jgi:hypothetical protein
MVILCTFYSAVRKVALLILVQNIFSTQDHAAAAYVDQSQRSLLILIHLKQYRCHWCPRLRVERGDRGGVLVVH